MLPANRSVLLCLAVLARLCLGQANSILFSQYIGAPTASATFDGPDASLSSEFLTICTNFLHGLPPLGTAIPSSLSVQLVQQAADGVCQACTSLSQSRVDSCCAQPTSVSCFAGFLAQQATPTATPATTVNGASTAVGTSFRNAGAVGADTDALAGSLVAAILSFVGWVL